MAHPVQQSSTALQKRQKRMIRNLMIILSICLQRFRNIQMIKIQRSLRSFCPGLKHYRNISENQRKALKNDMAAKAACYLSRYSGSIVYIIHFTFIGRCVILVLQDFSCIPIQLVSSLFSMDICPVGGGRPQSIQNQKRFQKEIKREKESPDCSIDAELSFCYTTSK